MEGVVAAIALAAVFFYFHKTTESQRQVHLLGMWLLLAGAAVWAVIRLLASL